ncbi:hypothetical protein L2E82_12285 [Cichorium intybus]|uniref:Uncharacterized protein n=1 Tax=Cichorium intybus TaxID=13427 RepID=A0ACB9GGP0_CICIN|nr:hypothetical protein L2E82_12285 [Cichorium intybus]
MVVDASIAISDKHVCHSSFSPTPPFLFPLSSSSAHDFPLLNNLLRNLLIFFVLHIRIGSKKSLFGYQIRSGRDSWHSILVFRLWL